jgi:hypothetical protein
VGFEPRRALDSCAALSEMGDERRGVMLLQIVVEREPVGVDEDMDRKGCPRRCCDLATGSLKGGKEAVISGWHEA